MRFAEPSDRRAGRPRFDLIRWFSVTGLLSIGAVSVAGALALSAFLTERMIRQEAEITAGFVRSIVRSERASSFFTADDPAEPKIEAMFWQMTKMPNVLRTNVYAPDRRVIWSSDGKLTGRRFAQNDELDAALQARLVVHSGIVDRAHLPKSEHQDFAPGVHNFVESYIPIFDERAENGAGKVIGVVELYKVPRELFDAIRGGERRIWAAAFAGGLFLYATLFWVVRRAHRIIERQREQLLESEALAIVGEMGSAVAHGLRNPLASIRSSAELALADDLPASARECASDIVAQVDRLEGWIRRLLTYAKPTHAQIAPVDINSVLGEALATYAPDLRRQRIATRLELADELPPVRGEAALLGQLVGSLIANASEAMRVDRDRGAVETEKKLIVRSRPDPAGGVIVEVIDNGPGISPDSAGRLFKPFYTTKPTGLGLGLPLVRRVVLRLGGAIELKSEPGAGTAVRLHLCAYGPQPARRYVEEAAS
jgi:two-component system, NtrC family, sensor histidine kinase HydH